MREPHRRRPDRSASRCLRPYVEPIERRSLLSMFMVTNALDNGDDANPVPGSLRAAIVSVDGDTTPDTIVFKVGGGGAATIGLASALPAITNTVTIDATGQSGYSGTPLVAVDATGAGPFADGLDIAAPGTIVEGLAIVGAGSSGIRIEAGADGSAVLADYLGVDPRTMQAAANNAFGLEVDASGCTIGGPAAGATDVISGNLQGGILITGPGNVVLGNRIGTGAGPIDAFPSAIAPLPNMGPGITIAGASGNIIGEPGAGNLIGSNRRGGIDLTSFASGNLIQANAIGTTLAVGNGIGLGPGNLGNGSDGIAMLSASSNTVGGTAAGAGNVISGNTGEGVDVLDGSGNLLLGNFIGTGADGATPRPNTADGVFIGGSGGNTVGGTAAGAGNVISGNAKNGVDIEGVASAGNLVLDNVIGVDATRRLPVGNANNGVSIGGAPANLVAGNLIGANLIDGVTIIQAPGNTIGGTTPADRNEISDNKGNGVSIRGPLASGNVVRGNYVGVNSTGKVALGNAADGVLIENAPGNTIGGTAAGAGNVISADQIGVEIHTYPDPAPGQLVGEFLGGRSDDNVVQGNLIGTDGSGALPLGNSQEGVLIVGGSGNLIGGTSADAPNVISGNLANGVGIEASTLVADPTSGNVVEGNLIGTAADGITRLGNRVDGVFVSDAPGNTIGGTAAGARNVISGNGSNGIRILGPSASTSVLGDYIGVDATGLAALANSQSGVDLEGATGVIVGSPVGLGRNVISGNGSSGITIGGGSSGNLVAGNDLGVAVDRLTVRGNNQSGVLIAGASIGNTIGGTTSGAGNVISGNSVGVTITNAGTSANLVEGDTIGLAVDGSTSVGNLGFGVLLLGGVTGNTIGGVSAGARNVISANGQGIGIIGPGSTGNLIEGDYVGLDASGSQPRGNLQLGIFLNGAADNTIGGTSSGAGNVISGNTGVGLFLFGPNSTGNLVAGNLIGLDATGSRIATASGQSLGNANFGVQVGDAPSNSIGGSTPGARNVISGNRQAGIDLSGSGASGTVIRGNFVGLDATGTVALGNLADGIQVDNAPANVIGGATDLERNVISGNLASGIEINGLGSTFDAVLGNYIGTDVTGTVALANSQSGVFVNGAPGVTIGGTIASLRNVISGNGRDGVRIYGTASTGTVVLGNYIGTDATGRAALGNLNDGVLFDSTAGATVGGTVPGSSNVISANASSGVEFGGSGTFFDVLQGNLIGTDQGGSKALGNAMGVFVNDSPFNLIGGTVPFSGNLISGNAGPGIHIFGVGALNNAVQGNRIGTDLAGLVPIANLAGVFIDGAPSNLVSGDLISGNTSAGVVIQGTGATGNLVQANLIGIDATGTRAIGSSSPQQSGVLIEDAPRNVVGGSTSATRNILSGNVVGVVITGFEATGNLVLGNFIGTDATGRAAVPDQTGVYINGSSSNVIGGSTPGSGNVISGNTAAGINFFGPQTTGNLVQGNFIGTDVFGTAALANSTGIFIESSPSNTIGGPTAAAGNVISGNSVAGAYLFDGSSGNLLQRNRIGVGATGKKLGNGQYGVLLYNAASNTVDMSKAAGNTIANSGIGNFREFTGVVPKTTTTTTSKKKTKTVTKAAHPTGPKVSARSISRPGSAGGSASTGRTGR